MRDMASINNVAMATLEVMYPFIVDIGCYSHTLDHVGDRFKTPILTEFIHWWLSLFMQPQSQNETSLEDPGRSQHGY